MKTDKEADDLIADLAASVQRSEKIVTDLKTEHQDALKKQRDDFAKREAELEAKIKAAGIERTSTIAVHQAERDRLATEKAAAAEARREERERLIAEKSAATAEARAALQKAAEIEAAAGGIAAVKEIVKQRRIREEINRKKRAEAEVIEAQKNIDALS